MAKKHMGKCSKSLVLREIKLTATTKYSYMPSKMFIKKKKKANNTKFWQECGGTGTLK